MQLTGPSWRSQARVLGSQGSIGKNSSIVRSTVAIAAEQGPLVVRQDPPRIQLSRKRPRISWFKWERRMYFRLLEQEREQALLGAGSTDEWYHSYWDNPASHQRWLEDQVRSGAWDEAIAAAAPFLQGKTVLDLGCGTATLAMLAAQAGAGRVFAVDASAGAAQLASKLVEANGLSRQVSVLRARGEVVELPVPKVDVILCDWMGHMLLHNGLLPVLGRVRDRWLAPDGLILPDKATLFVMAVDDREFLAEQKGFWGRGAVAAGLDMSPVLNAVVAYPRVDTISRRSQMVTDAQPLLSLDAYTAGAQSLSFKQPFKLSAQRSERVSGLLLYFDAVFTCRGQLEQPVTLTTHPMSPATNWLQMLLSFPRSIKLEKGKVLSGMLSCKPAGPPLGRMLDLDLEIAYEGLHARVAYRLRQ